MTSTPSLTGFATSAEYLPISERLAEKYSNGQLPSGNLIPSLEDLEQIIKMIDANDSSMKFKGAAIGYSNGVKLVSSPDLSTHMKGSTLHAENAVLMEVNSMVGMLGKGIDTMAVLRIGPNGRFSSSVPCAICKKALKLAGVKHLYVVYQGEFDLLTLQNDFYS